MATGEAHTEDPSTRLTTHEAVCAERHASIGARLTRIETIMIGTAGGTILLLVNALMATRAV